MDIKIRVMLYNQLIITKKYINNNLAFKENYPNIKNKLR